jgi:Ca2+-binding RTX toxin-like protein
MSLLSTKRIIIGVGALFLSIGVAGAVEAATTTKTSSGVVCTKVGTAGSDVLTGTTGIDVICGLGGNDTINGLAGNDIIDGGVGNDVINAGDGNDTIYGGVGDDKLRGDAGNDTVNGDAGNDTETGGLGDDGLSGGLGDDTVSGGDGVDTLNGNDGTDVLTGDAGNDKVYGNFGDDTVSGGLGNDTVSGDAGNDTETGGDGNDVIKGGDGNDNLQGGVGNDSFYGDAGNDTLFGGDGTDTIRGGDGNDSAYGENGNDTVTGSLGNDVLNGGAGDDTVSGETGNDKVYGGDGTDILAGNTGNDTITGDAGNDSISGGDGTDNVTGGVGNDTLNGDAGNDILGSGDGTDSINGGDGNDGVSGGLGDDAVTGGAGDDALSGNGGNDTIGGGDGTDQLFGSDGNDSLNGGAGNDSIAGDLGNDVVSGDSGVDNLLGGAGNDTMAGGDGNDTMAGGDGNDRLVGDAGDDTMRGEAGNDGLIGGAGTDNLAGANGVPAQTERNLCEKDANDTVTYCGFDNAAPWVVSAELAKTSVDSSTSAQTVVVTMHVTDELMGVDVAACSLFLEGARMATGYDRAVRISGDAIDGIYTCNVTIPLGGSTGRWGVNFNTSDRAGNNGFADQFTDRKGHSNLPEIMDQKPEHWIEQTGAGDSLAPRISEISFNKTQIDTSAVQDSFSVEMSVTDDYSGVDHVQCGLRHNAVENMDIKYSVEQVSGTSMSGVWRCNFTLPQNSGKGKWLVGIFVFDKVGKLYSLQGNPTQENKWAVDDTSLLYSLPDLTMGVNSVDQVGAGDDELPVMTGISLDKTTVNTSSSDQTVVATLHLTDVKSGIKSAELRSFSPTTFAQNVSYCKSAFKDDAGNEVWTCTLKLPLGSQKGLHAFSIMMYDKVGNRVTYDLNKDTGLWRLVPLSFYGDFRVENLDLGPTGVMNTD